MQSGVHFGVSGTSETGTYVTPPPSTSAITSVGNNFDGTYTLTTNGTLSTGGAVSGQPNFVFYDPGSDVWRPAIFVSSPDDQHLIFTSGTGSSSFTKWILITDLSGINVNPVFALPQTGTI